MTHRAAADVSESLVRIFVELADTLTEDYDLADFLDRLVERCSELFGLPAVTLLLVDQRGGVQLMASNSERAEKVELAQLHASSGPGLDCITTSAHAWAADLAADAGRWPAWSPVALEAGFRSVYATPMTLRTQTIGALDMFSDTTYALSDSDLDVVRALADMATIGILQERAVRRGEVLSEQLEVALNSRVVIEQAKGVLAGRAALDLSVDRAFLMLREHSRRTGVGLGVLARSIVDGTLDPAVVLAASTRRP